MLAQRRPATVRDAVLDAAEALFAEHGYASVSVRDIARAAGAHAGSITYHFGSKAELLRTIYRRHCGPMNTRRLELLGEARRLADPVERLQAILRAYALPAFSNLRDDAGGGARFTRLRAVMSAEGNDVAREIIAEAFDATSHAFIDALDETLPHLERSRIVWRSQFLLGALYYTLVNPERVTRLSRGAADGGDMARALEELVASTLWGLAGPAEGGLTGGAPAAAVRLSG
ncbi:MAG: TetR/AcrR family transcriptional regulator [Azospirillaceae bacterium]